MNYWRWFIGSGEGGVLYYFDVPSILVGFFAGVIITLLIFIVVHIFTRGHK
jgi:hypothetical protein